MNEVNPLRFLSTLLIASTLHARSNSLKVEITAPGTVVDNQGFYVRATIRNVGQETATLHVSQCWRSAMQWTSDTPAVSVDGITCKKNRLVDISLKAGGAEEIELPVHVSLPARQLGAPAALRFRLGFIRRDSDPLAANAAGPAYAPSPLLWSNFETITVEPGK